MKVLIVYDSTYGNTEKIARAIGAAITGEVKILRAGEVNVDELSSYDLLVIGSPTQGGRPLPSMMELLDKIPASVLRDKNFAAFDTRIPAKIAKLFGYAAAKIDKSLKAKGGSAVVSPEGFFVTLDKKPQLKEGELEHVTNWVKTLTK